MNPAPTPARNTSQDTAFSVGASKSVNKSPTASDNDPETVADRRDLSKFRGSDQPIRHGQKRKFFDRAENHPIIPKSSMTEFAEQAIPAPGSESGDASLLRDGS